MSDPVERTLTCQLSSLSLIVERANVKADIGGLEAQHFLSSIGPEYETLWRVSCADSNWVAENKIHLQRGDFGKLAALGYSISNLSPSERTAFSSVFIQGVEQLRRRELFPSDQVAFPNMPRVFLGIALGILSLPFDDRERDLLTWLREVASVAISRNRPRGSERLLYQYVDSLLNAKAVNVADSDAHSSLVEMAITEWGMRRGVFQTETKGPGVVPLQERILLQACLTNLDDLHAGDAAVVWSALKSCLSASIHDSVMATPHVVLILSRFESSMRRWRWDDPTRSAPLRWPVIEEREVQDIAWLILRGVFDDLVDEDTLPKVGHSSYRSDFGIPSIGTLVEVKFARSAGDFRRIEKEVMEDSVGYLLETKNYQRLVVFIYDDSASVQEHSVTSRALEQLPNVEGVVIVSRPSQLPRAMQQRE